MKRVIIDFTSQGQAVISTPGRARLLIPPPTITVTLSIFWWKVRNSGSGPLSSTSANKLLEPSPGNVRWYQHLKSLMPKDLLTWSYMA